MSSSRSRRLQATRFVPGLVILALAVALAPAALRAGETAAKRRRPHGDVPLTILQTTDLHHHANGATHVDADGGDLGTYARIAAYVGFVRQSAGHAVVVVDSGDWTMGTPYDLTLASRPLALRFLKAMKYDAVTLGNHEFDYTPAGLALMIAAAKSSFGFQVPIVASNMDLHGDADLAPFVGPGKAIQTTRVEQLPNGLRIGYIGLMGRDAAFDAVSAPVTFTTDYAAIQALVNALRQQRGADLVVALSHSGTDASGESGEDVELARNVTGIDVIASGHTHTPLAGAHAVAHGDWTTQIVDAGAFGTNVARLDLTFHTVTRTVTVDGASNLAMTDDTLAAIRRWLRPDPAIAALVHAYDLSLNHTLAPLFEQLFGGDFSAADVTTGLYHVVGQAAQDMVPNDVDPVLAPNGLGDLAADALRAVPNQIIARTLAAAGGNPANVPGYDFHPFQVAIVPTGVLRGVLPAHVALTFSDVYDVLPLGFTPDGSQAFPITYPTISTYLEPEDVAKVCALQLVAQSNLIGSSFYLNLSGLQYSLKPDGAYAYFKYATAAGTLAVTGAKAAAGSTAAQEALAALQALGSHGAASLLVLAGEGNPYAAAMVHLNDASPDAAQTAANLGALGQVAGAAAADAATGSTTLPALLVARALAAIDTVSAFAPGDVENTGAAAPLGAGRVRVAVDLYAVLLLGAVEQRFGIDIRPFAAATGSAELSGSNLPGLMANRIDADPSTAGVQELKEWLALLQLVGDGLGGAIGPEYASTPLFIQFPTFGAAVRTRNASYPLAAVGQLATTLGVLAAAP